jgi:hypothetical protein
MQRAGEDLELISNWWVENAEDIARQAKANTRIPQDVRDTITADTVRTWIEGGAVSQATAASATSAATSALYYVVARDFLTFFCRKSLVQRINGCYDFSGLTVSGKANQCALH